MIEYEQLGLSLLKMILEGIVNFLSKMTEILFLKNNIVLNQTNYIRTCYVLIFGNEVLINLMANCTCDYKLLILKTSLQTLTSLEATLFCFKQMHIHVQIFPNQLFL